MSEFAPESAPQTTESIAASVVEQAEQQSVETPDTRINTTDVTVSEPVKAEPEVKLSPAAEFLLKQGHKLKKDDGREVWLPAKTVEGMLARYVDEHKSGWDGEKNTLASQAKEYQEQIGQLKAA